MLDLGVGAGRTSIHFAPAAKSYIGIDYSSAMVVACEEMWGSKFPNASFLYADARQMSQFENNSFDFILFSFNGIDCVDYNDRQLVFKEIKRLGIPSGYFCFSSHNIQHLPILYSFQFPKNPFNWIKEYKRYSGVNKHNRPYRELLKEPFSFLRDGFPNFETQYCYISPQAQLDELAQYGFREVQIFDLKSGKELTSSEAIKLNTDPWLYYLCKF
jgi:ubiquinone/menaquinone biosynthesis C-methylase UbiE